MPQMDTFVADRIQTHKVAFWNAIPNLKIKTFDTLAKKTKIKTADNKVVTVAADRALFGRLVISARSRNINLKDVLSYELSTVPYALAHSDSSLRKTTKSVFLSEFEKKLKVLRNLRVPRQQMQTACVIDIMTYVQMLKSGGASTFGELADKHFSLITAPFSYQSCSRVDVVFDQYMATSIKAGERTKRGASTALEVKIQNSSTPMPKQWAKYISNPQNKINLGNFLADSWREMAEAQLQIGQTVVLGGGFTNSQKAFKVTKGHCEDVSPLESDHEEADTRLLLHAKHASHNHNRIVIQSSDTDVAVLCAAHFNNMGCDELWFRTGNKYKLRYIPMHRVALNLGARICDALLPFHALTGCDSNSSLSGVGKKKAFGILCGSEVHQSSLSLMGKETTLSEETISGCEAFVCSLYTDNKKAGTTADNVRYWMFC